MMRKYPLVENMFLNWLAALIIVAIQYLFIRKTWSSFLYQHVPHNKNLSVLMHCQIKYYLRIQESSACRAKAPLITFINSRISWEYAKLPAIASNILAIKRIQLNLCRTSRPYNSYIEYEVKLNTSQLCNGSLFRVTMECNKFCVLYQCIVLKDISSKKVALI